MTTKGAAKLAFFMLPSRAWELLIGSLTAWYMLRRPSLQVSGSAKYLALVIIGGTCVVGFSPIHPSVDALIVTVATAVLLIGGDNWLRHRLPFRIVARIGDWSYSLYLVHWPLFAFAFILWIGNPPQIILIGLTLLALLLGWAQYRFIELPFSPGGSQADSKLQPIFTSMMGMGLVAAGFIYLSPRDKIAPPMAGLDAACDQSGGTFEALPKCRTGANPRLLLWGDSYAMHLVPGIRRELGFGFPIVQATKSACVPVLGLAHITPQYSRSWASECISFNQSIIAALSHLPSVRDVVIASSWSQVLKPSNSLLINGQEQSWSPAAQEHLVQTIQTLKKMGKRVIIIGPTAVANYDVGACNDRVFSDRVVIGRRDCNPIFNEVYDNIGDLDSILDVIATHTGIKFVRPAAVMCPGRRCISAVSGHSLYRDNGHLTPFGSVYVLRSLHFRELISK